MGVEKSKEEENKIVSENKISVWSMVSSVYRIHISKGIFGGLLIHLAERNQRKLQSEKLNYMVLYRFLYEPGIRKQGVLGRH